MGVERFHLYVVVVGVLVLDVLVLGRGPGGHGWEGILIDGRGW